MEALQTVLPGEVTFFIYGAFGSERRRPATPFVTLD